MAAPNFSVTYQVIDKGKNATGFNLDNDINGAATLEDLLKFTKRALILISGDALKEEQSRGFDKNPTLIVDNKFNSQVDNVKPLGKIEYVARAEFKMMILETYRKIMYYSKVKTGRYLNSNVVTYNGTMVATNIISLENWLKTKTEFSDRDIIRFVNFQPYARKLETLGVTRQRSQGKPKRVLRKKKRGKKMVTLPNGAYAMAFMSVKRRFKKNVFIGMDLLPGNKLGLNSQEGKFKGKKAKREGYWGQPYIYPTIILRAVSAGLTDAGGMLQ